MKVINLLFIVSISSCLGQINNVELKKKKQKEIIEQFATYGAEYFNYNYEMYDWQSCLDQGLKKDKTIAELWQMKAMPYFKNRKYEVGMKYIDQAVKYNSKEWQPYRAFIKCIFSKNYKDAISDFEDCKKKYGNNYINDHTYDFYIGLSYLQLNEFEKAQKIFKSYINQLFNNRQGLENPTVYFYYGITFFEKQNFEEAIVQFDKALKIYPNFSDVEYYKAACLAKLNYKNEVDDLYNKSLNDYKLGFTINEYNTAYEKYPYQVRWD